MHRIVAILALSEGTARLNQETVAIDGIRKLMQLGGSGILLRL